MIDYILIGNNQIEKHVKYKNQYLSGEIFWGLGIENELYLEFENKKKISEKEFLNNHKKERYSVDYYSNYKKEELENGFKKMIKFMGSNVLFIPVMMNSHSFTKTDHKNNSKTLYTKKGEENPNFTGKTLIELLAEKDEYFNQEKENSIYPNNWIFDGDTIEFVSTKFYKVKLNDIINELVENKNIFINKLNYWFEKENIFQEYGKIKFMEQNNPYACYLTNIENISMFNNGTIHLNITLPTKLNNEQQIEDKKIFIEKHKELIKIIQWLEPIIIGTYGSPDPFATLYKFKDRQKFSNCSQRNIVSRYISIGSYDTDEMEPGKILTKPLDFMELNKLDYWWFNRYHKRKSNAYVKLEQIGLDINFNKHWNHGIEIRFLDHISNINLIKECFEFVIYLADFSLDLDLDSNRIPNPIKDKVWNEITYKVMIDGMDTILNKEETEFYEKIFGFKIKKNKVVDIYYEIFLNLKNKYNPIYKSIIKINGKKKEISIPCGKFSSLVLDNEDVVIRKNNIKNEEKKQNKQDLENTVKTIDKIVQTDEINLEIIEKNRCCIIM